MAYDPELYWEGRLSKTFSLEAVGFDSFGKGYNRWLYKMSARSLERAIKRGLIEPQGKAVLEIGCGTGFYVDIWQKHGITDLVGVDITEASVTELKRRYPSYRFYQRDIGSEAFGIHSQAYEIVTAFAVLFHIVDDGEFNQAVRNISNLCARAGTVLITDIFSHKRAYVLPHQKSRTLAEYTKVLSENGLQVVSRVPVYYLLNAPLDVSNRMIQKLALVWWKYFVGGIELTTHLLGPLFYGLDSILTRVCSESPSTEMMICRKI